MDPANCKWPATITKIATSEIAGYCSQITTPRRQTSLRLHSPGQHVPPPHLVIFRTIINQAQPRTNLQAIPVAGQQGLNKETTHTIVQATVQELAAVYTGCQHARVQKVNCRDHWSLFAPTASQSTLWNEIVTRQSLKAPSYTANSSPPYSSTHRTQRQYRASPHLALTHQTLQQITSIPTPQHRTSISVRTHTQPPISLQLCQSAGYQKLERYWITWLD